MIEKYRSYVPIIEKIAFAKKISENPAVVDEYGIINKNNLKIASTAFFVGAYVEDRDFTTDDYDFIRENNIDNDLRGKLTKDEVKEWDTILDNEINLIAMRNKMQSTNVMAAIVSLLNSVQKNVDPKNFDKMMKHINKIIDDPNKLKNFQILQQTADSLK